MYIPGPPFLTLWLLYETKYKVALFEGMIAGDKNYKMTGFINAATNYNCNKIFNLIMIKNASGQQVNFHEWKKF